MNTFHVRPIADAFLQNIAQRHLMVAQSRATGQILDFAASWDVSDLVWHPASGLARLFSYTVLWQAYRANLAVPYNVAWVELAEGPRIISTVITGDQTALRVGIPLRARFQEDGQLVFEPQEQDSALVSQGASHD